MHEYYFANYRLLVDDEISGHDSMRYLSAFRDAMPYIHTFTVRMGEEGLLEEKYEETLKHRQMFSTGDFAIFDDGDTWSILRWQNEPALKYHLKYVVTASRDYGEMVVYMSSAPYYSEKAGIWVKRKPRIPFSSFIRTFCEAGMVMRDGLPLHASMVEKDGQGLIFLGPSGMGKSTQAKLWEKYQKADFIIGDRPGLRCIDGRWYGFGMPWDGKDNIRNQKKVPVRALISLEQAKENRIERLTERQAMMALLNQAMMPMWDDAAMDKVMVLIRKLAVEIPFYHLKNLADENATDITYGEIFGGVWDNGKSFI